MYELILVGLDGSACAMRGGELALRMAKRVGANVVAAHVYSDGLHARRFRDMEPGLPREYQGGERRRELRGLHGDLIADGFHALSLGYLDPLIAEGRRAGVAVRPFAIGGRHWVRLVELARELHADLLVVGARGLGWTEGEQLGSAADRVLRHAGCDVLVAREGGVDGPVLAGVDGSEDALLAVERAVAWAGALRAPLELVAAYDPEFHCEVFRTMARAIPPERQAQVGLANQEELHDRLINRGLDGLYRGFLEQASSRVGGRVAATTRLCTGKAAAVLQAEAAQHGAGLLVAGRFGHHREPQGVIGYTSAAVASRSCCSVLVTAAAPVRSTQAARGEEA